MSLNRYMTEAERLASRFKILQEKQQLQANYSDPLAKIQEYEQQKQQYNNTVAVTQEPTYQELFITKKAEIDNNDIGKQLNILTQHILTIADNENTQYIVNRLNEVLTPEQIKLLNAKWVDIEHKFKKQFSKGLDKDVFLDYLVDYMTNDSSIQYLLAGINERDLQFHEAMLDQPMLDETMLNETMLNRPIDATEPIDVAEVAEPRQEDKAVDDIINIYNHSVKTGVILKEQLATEFPDYTPSAQAKNNKSKILADFKKWLTQEIQNEINQENKKPLTRKVTGKGLKSAKRYKKKINFMTGGGALKLSPTTAQYYPLNKYMLNVTALQKKNQLAVKYANNRNIIAKLPKQIVSNDVKNILLELVMNNNFNRALFNKMTEDDRKLVTHVLNVCHIDVGLQFKDQDQEEFMKQYTILTGAFNAGNKSPELRAQLKDCIMLGIHKKRIPFHSGLGLLEKILKTE